MRRPPTKDYYKILGVPKEAETAEIKRAYRKLAVELHPDHNQGNPECEEKFKDITEAYGVLIDPKKRRQYDLFRSSGFSNSGPGSSDFRYSQQDIFEEMFNNSNFRDIFEELNRDFSRSGFRSGPGFFQNMFFGGGGGLWKLLWLLPGPFGKIANGLRLIQMIGSFAMIFSRFLKVNRSDSSKFQNSGHSFTDSLKQQFFNKPSQSSSNPLDMEFLMIIPESEANFGTEKQISYKVNEILEQLMIKIPSGTYSGQKFRVKEKGRRQNGKRGDLILSVQVKNKH